MMVVYHALKMAVVIVLGYVMATPSHAQATNGAVTQATTKTTICTTGYTATIRPTLAYTNGIKRHMMQAAGVTDSRAFVADHILPLEVGGAPRDPRNFMLQNLKDGKAKDAVENRVHRAVCSGKATLAEGQACFGSPSAWKTCAVK